MIDWNARKAAIEHQIRERLAYFVLWRCGQSIGSVEYCILTEAIGRAAMAAESALAHGGADDAAEAFGILRAAERALAWCAKSPLVGEHPQQIPSEPLPRVPQSGG